MTSLPAGQAHEVRQRDMPQVCPTLCYIIVEVLCLFVMATIIDKVVSCTNSQNGSKRQGTGLPHLALHKSWCVCAYVCDKYQRQNG